MRLRKLPQLLPVFVLIVLGAGCAPEVRRSDDGHYAWARQIVPSLLGRQPAGEAEVRLIVDFASRIGRQQTADALMRTPEFAAYWSDLIVDLVRAQREGNKDLRECIGSPARRGPATAELANWVKSNDPSNTTPPGGEFNLADLLISSVLADDLSPFFRAYTFALASRPLLGNEITERNRRDDLYSSFEGTLLGRNSTCLVCHNASWSHTGRASGWNRTFAPLGYFERGLLGAHSGAADPGRVTAMFRVRGVIDGRAPWGMVGCGNFQTPATDDPELPPGQQAYLAGDQGRRASIFTVEQLLHSGIRDLRDGLNRSVAPRDEEACVSCGSCPPGATEPNLTQEQKEREAKVQALFERKRCFTCHAGGSGGLMMPNNPAWKNQLVRVASSRGAPKSRVEPVHAGRSFLMDALGPTIGIGYPMPQGGDALNAAELADVRAWIEGLPAMAGCGTCAANNPGLTCPAPVADVPGNEALAYLVALNLTDNIWGQMMGRPLTIAHNYSRNDEQNQLLWHLTEFQFIANGWSLKKLLNFIVTSDYYNRRPPKVGGGIAKPSGGSSPYDLPMFFDPWVAQDPRVPPATDPGYVAGNHPERHGNAMSEAIERKAPVTLLRSVAFALGWPEPRRIPGNAYPSRELARSIGQFLQDAAPGFRGHNFSALVEWEANVATCRKPDQVAIDWIDRVEAAIRNHNNAAPNDLVTVIQAAELVKDWLLADGRMSVPERAHVAQLFGRGENESVVLVPSVNDRLRDFCGVLLQTPHFTLAGATTDGAGPRPKLRVCNASSCDYKDLCERLTSQAGLHRIISCDDESVQLIGSSPIVGKPAPRDQRERVAKLSSDIVRGLSTDAAHFRLPVEPDQLRQARVQRAKGVAILTSDELIMLQPGAAIPANALVLSERGAELLLDINRATIPIQLAQQLPEGTLEFLEHQLEKLPRDIRSRAITAVKEGKPLAAMAGPGHAKSPVPPGVVDATLSSAFPYGSAAEPIKPERRTTPFDDRALQQRFKSVREMRK